jgi:hypothetical protein
VALSLALLAAPPDPGAPMYHMYRKALGWFAVGALVAQLAWIFHYLPAWRPFRRRYEQMGGSVDDAISANQRRKASWMGDCDA